MRFSVDINRDRDGHYEGALAWEARKEPFEFSGLLELLSVIERELTAEADQAGPPTHQASGTPRHGNPTTGADGPGTPGPNDRLAQL